MIARLVRADEWLIALGLLTAAVVLSPPRGDALSVAVVLLAAVTLTGVALFALRRARVMRAARLGAWARATAALALSASVMMILGASVAAIG